MKVLWLCNIMLPEIARELNISYSNREGWLSGLYDHIMKDENTDIELLICFPFDDRETQNAIKAKAKSDSYKDIDVKNVIKFNTAHSTCYGFREELTTPEKYDAGLEELMQFILQDANPDIVHIFGSEFPHALAMARASGRRGRILLSIQGLCGKIADVYTEGIPSEIIESETFRDIVKNDSITQQKQKFEQRAVYEKELFSLVNHISGRTNFDKEATSYLNPNAAYHHLNENMRESFYRGRWNSNDCEPYTIFLSQGDYPIKGFHLLLKAMPKILLKYPEARLYVAGNDILGSSRYDVINKLKKKVKISSYGKYIKSLIFKNQLEENVIMTGPLDEEMMKERFLKSSVFICPSIIENSPNALCEAMLLGMPVVAAAVGGIPCLINDCKDGLLYEPGNISDLAAAVQIAWNRETAEEIGEAAAKRALKRHNRILNFMELMEIYKEIIKGNK
ncbi:MAG: glycosyltransferase family 4 protein [Lachnospiraceae bacterium]|nr:glycosyltransferase family 4 protein [Lachnospiraceae bacterium]